MIKVFISSPYTIGDQGENVRVQMDCANELMNNGFNTFIPLLFHFQNMVHRRDWKSWMELTIDWMTICDCVLRLPGESKGADIEVEKAKELGIPVFYDIKELYDFYIYQNNKV